MAQCRQIPFIIQLQFHVSHALAGSLQKIRRIIQIGAEKESHVHVRREHIYVSECDIPDTGNGTAIVHQLANVLTTAPHVREPCLCQLAKAIALRTKPGIHCRIMSHRRWQPEQFSHDPR
jgi:hypothetical protein